MNSAGTTSDRPAPPEEPPPFLGCWRRVYAGVIGWLVFLIASFYWFARSFAP